jgi:ElaB/YqjD/DUF883 family membrane-anchored ribosome-binding protein
MANKTELIRQQMSRTRESLRQKLDALEDRTLGVVENTADAVANVAETVEDTVETAKEAVTKTTEKAAQMFDINRHVDEHPWAVMGGAVATGFALSVLLSRTRSTAEVNGGPAPYDVYPRYEPQPASSYEESHEESEPRQSWLSSLMEQFAPQLDTLKQLAIGTAVGTLRDLALRNIPREWSKDFAGLFDSFTERLGGSTLPEHEPAQTQTATPPEARSRWEQQPHGSDHPHARKKHGNGKHARN